MEELRAVIGLVSSMFKDADDLPSEDGGIYRFWSSCEEDLDEDEEKELAVNLVPGEQVFVVFNREPKDEDEAWRVAEEYFSACGYIEYEEDDGDEKVVDNYPSDDKVDTEAYRDFCDPNQAVQD
jgi:hypothetical protein